MFFLSHLFLFSIIKGAVNFSQPLSLTLFYLIIFLKVPIPSMEHSTTSPDFRNCGGFMPMAVPAGVPVAMIVPACSVIPWDSSLMI